ncbi:TetR/AcrR family transcriptional regulator [Marinobacter zhejiangensis]|uniref:Transcriptional regulator, TetR family n=1 Tax=Marinobacter zhejiangensis TaxID=488535 RepID=A0A1I4NBZ6_9GAMM|nr:TetR/AcrR family transcriptional regulator [Marinobacter zhejiangensis]SFM12999.1 transcriptional regulator, TetR family [Marinobacter zhejiangensis]
MTASPDRASPAATDKRQRILDAALKVFASRGVHGTPVPPIAREAGISVGSLYRYFDSKEALVNTLFRETKQLLAEQLLGNLPIQQPSRALFNEIWNRLCTFARKQPNAFRFLEMQDHHSYLDDASLASERQLLMPLRQLIELAQQAGVLGSHLRPEVAMALFWGAFVGLFKAERLAYLKLTDDDLQCACDACWTVLQSQPPCEQQGD